MSYYADVIKHVEKRHNARTNLRFSNYGTWHFCAKGKLSPFLIVAFMFDEQDGTFTYYQNTGLSHYVTGVGCMPNGASCQERWRMADLDDALIRLACYISDAKEGETLPHHDICLFWDEATREKYGVPK